MELQYLAFLQVIVNILCSAYAPRVIFTVVIVFIKHSQVVHYGMFTLYYSIHVSYK